MAGMFDDLVPQQSAPGGAFDDLIPAQASAAAPSVPAAGPVVMDDGSVREPLSPLVRRFATDPRVQAARALQRGTLGGEAQAIPIMAREALHGGLVGSMMDYQDSGAAAAQDAENNAWRAGMAGGGLDQLDPRQRQLAMLDPLLEASQRGDLPGRPAPTAADFVQQAAQQQAQAGQLGAQFAQARAPLIAENEAIPSWTTAQGAGGKTLAGASSLVANLVPGFVQPENLAFGGAGSTLARSVGINALAGAAADVPIQANRMGAGVQEQFDPLSTAASAALGGTIGGAMHVAPALFAQARAWLARGRGVEANQIPDADVGRWLDQVQAANEGAVLTPEMLQEAINRGAGLDTPAPFDRSTVEGRRGARATESELANLFNQETDILPRAGVDVTSEGLQIPEGLAPVRDAAGEQARIDTLEPRAYAANVARRLGMENPSAQELDALASYRDQGLNPVEAANAFARARTADARQGMTPELERTAGERANSRQFAQEAFDLADLRRQRRDADLARDAETQPSYQAGELDAETYSPRLEQDIAARSMEPPRGVGEVSQPQPRRAVDVVSSQQLGGLRGEYIPGERPAPDIPPAREAVDIQGERPPARSMDEIFAAEGADGVRAELERRALADNSPAAVMEREGPRAAGREAALRDRSTRVLEDQPRPDELEAETRTLADDQEPDWLQDRPGADDNQVRDARIAELERQAKDDYAAYHWSTRDKNGWLRSDVTPTERLNEARLKMKWAEKMLEINKLKGLQTDLQEKNMRTERGRLAEQERLTREWEAKQAAKEKPATPETPASPPAAMLDDLAGDLEALNWAEKGGKLLRDQQGQASGRTTWLSNNPELWQAIRDSGYSKGEALNIINRVRSGKGRPLTEKQQRLVESLQEYHSQRTAGPDADRPPEPDLEPPKRTKRHRDDPPRELPEEAYDDFDLETQTEKSRQASEQRTRERQAQADKQRSQEAQKAQADKDRNDFTLTGSDHPADVGAARGQKDIFGGGQLFDVTGAAMEGMRRLAKRLWQGDDEATLRENAGSLAQTVADMWGGNRPTKRGALHDAARRFFDSADGSLRSIAKPFKSDTLSQLADVFHATAGQGKKAVKATMDERVQQELNPRINNLEHFSDWFRKGVKDNGLDAQTARNQVVRLVENPKTPRTGFVGEAAKRVDAMLKDMEKYLRDAGVEFGRVEGYFPRELDQGKVMGDRAGFIREAAKAYRQDNPGMRPDDAQRAAESYWESAVYGDTAKPGTPTLGRGGQPSFLKGRKLTKAAAEHLAPYYARDLDAVLSQYMVRAVKRAELAKSGVDIDGKFQPFGDNFKNWDTIQEAIRKEDPDAVGIMPEVNDLVATSAGMAPSGASDWVRRGSSWARTATTLGALEKSAFASIGELAMGPLRGAVGDVGDLPNAVGNIAQHAYNTVRAVGGKGARSKRLQEMFQFAEDVSAIAGSGHHSIMAARFAGGDPVGQLQSKMLSGFFKRNLLEQLTNYTRAVTADQARVFLRRVTADKMAGKARQDLFLGELGIPKDKAAEFSKYVQQFGNETPTADQLQGPMGQLYRTAILRFADQTVQRPNQSTRPAWASTPLGSMIFQLQAFNYAFQKNVLNRWGRVLANGDLSKAERVALAATMGGNAAAMVAVQGAVGELRKELYNRPDDREMTPGADLEQAISRAGLLGIADPFVQMASGGIRYGTSPTNALLGPTLGSLANVGAAAAGAMSANNSPNTNTAERRLMRQAYGTIAEPALQAALTPLPAGLLANALTMWAVPKSGEWATDAVLPADANTKAQPPVQGLVETVLNGRAKAGAEGGRPQRPDRSSRPARPKRPER
ncbi:hypothetical protein IB275_30485 [Pseudomonas sp. PDM21]|uniref:hypothetical protein n=1 Tax=Pseudomonas sp. PDM21 TaxID=2769257 RepID=UPI00177D5662|nr:hypothetical protein [Pseudomonas sp. PDM21]MBD9674944.1 hypothetical protein [Pseudomonas sp. PDM21]